MAMTETTEWNRLQRIRDRQRRRRRNPTPEEVYECIEDCDSLIDMVERHIGSVPPLRRRKR